MIRPPSAVRQWLFGLSLVLFPFFAWLTYFQGRQVLQHHRLLEILDHRSGW